MGGDSLSFYFQLRDCAHCRNLLLEKEERRGKRSIFLLFFVSLLKTFLMMRKTRQKNRLIITTLIVSSGAHGLLQPLACPSETGQATIKRAKRYFSLGNKVKQQLGPTNPDDLQAELADDFKFVAPLVGPLSKDELIAATTGLDLATAIPDFDARYHDYRVDADDENRVWCTMRVIGTQTGPLQFGGLNAPPSSPPIRVESPPEAVSLRFDATSGKLRELTTGCRFCAHKLLKMQHCHSK